VGYALLSAASVGDTQNEGNWWSRGYNMLSADTVEVTRFGARGYIKVSAATAEVTPQILNRILAKNRKMSVSQCS
jgi:hypothetical protein